MATVTFLCVDENEFKFLEWNWYSDEPEQKIFHLSKSAVMKRREIGFVADDPAVKEVLEEIG